MMDGNRLEELRTLVEFLKANEIAEFDMEQADLKVRIKFAGEPAASVGGFDMAQLSRLMASAPAAPVAAAGAPVASWSGADPADRGQGRVAQSRRALVDQKDCGEESCGENRQGEERREG